MVAPTAGMAAAGMAPVGMTAAAVPAELPVPFGAFTRFMTQVGRTVAEVQREFQPVLTAVGRTITRALPQPVLDPQQKDRVRDRVEKMVNDEYKRYCIDPTEAKQIAEDFVDALTPGQLKYMDDNLRDFAKTRTKDYDTTVGQLKKNARLKAEGKGGAEGDKAKKLWAKYDERRALLKAADRFRKEHTPALATYFYNIDKSGFEIESETAKLQAETDAIKRREIQKKIQELEAQRKGNKDAADKYLQDKKADPKTPVSIRKAVELTELEKQVTAIKTGPGTDDEKQNKAKDLIDRMKESIGFKGPK